MTDQIKYEACQGGRIVKCFCARCGVLWDGLIQSEQRDGSWSPDLEKTLTSVQGWMLTADGKWCCTRMCKDVIEYAQRTKGKAPEPVLRINDKSYVQPKPLLQR